MGAKDFEELRQQFAAAERQLRDAMRAFMLAAVKMEAVKKDAPPELANAAAAMLARCPVRITPLSGDDETTKH